MFVHLKITFVNLFPCLVMFFITNSQYRIFIVPRKHYCQKYNISKKSNAYHYQKSKQRPAAKKLDLPP